MSDPREVSDGSAEMENPPSDDLISKSQADRSPSSETRYEITRTGFIGVSIRKHKTEDGSIFERSRRKAAIAPLSLIKYSPVTSPSDLGSLDVLLNLRIEIRSLVTKDNRLTLVDWFSSVSKVIGSGTRFLSITSTNGFFRKSITLALERNHRPPCG
ncbi:hypothetical protein GC170_13170 [bacterium]|nr:hypothetical protein [bacterium]